MRREQGFFLPLSAPLLLTLLLLVGTMLTISLVARERSKVQAIVDVSLLSAMNRSCPSIECFDDVRRTAIDTLRSNFKSPELDELLANDLDESGNARTRWESEHFTVELERGRWKPLKGFESVENEWQGFHPGIPAHAVTHAMRLRVESRVSPVLGLLPRELLPTGGSGTALASLVNEDCVAPFAIPLCSIVDAAGNFDQEKLSRADRLFTSPNRYRSGANRDVVPDFDWSLVDASALNSPDALQAFFDGLGVEYADGAVRSCSYPTTRFSSLSDHFGVVGIPGDVVPNEELVKFILTGKGCAPAVVGQQFKVLHDDLTDTETQELLWAQVSNRQLGHATDGTHRPLSELVDGHLPIKSQSLFFSKEPFASSCQAVAEGRKAPDGAFDYRPNSGVCNSRRSGYGMNRWDDFAARVTTNDDGKTLCPYQDAEFEKPYWKIKVPIIADEREDAASCQGFLGSSEDPIPSTSDDYSIVGFITIGIYDMDIGNDAPSLGTFPLSNDGVKECTGLASYGRIIPETNEFPFGFKDASSSSDSCNVVRARIDRKVQFIAGSEDDMIQPVIVE